ncbi:MAG: iron ABC transporter permease [Clostridia bacterium]|nr:iron ABC transporter permease [Clostridia bacterium]
MQTAAPRKPKYGLGKLWGIFGGVLFLYLFLGFMIFPCWDTIKSVFTAKEGDPFAVINYFLAGNMSHFIWGSLKLGICLVITVNIVGISIVLLTEYFDIKGAKILRLGYMTSMIYSGVALVTGFMFLYDKDGLITKMLIHYKLIPETDKNWFAGFYAVLFTMTFACTSNHALFLRNAIRGIDYNTVEAARNMGSNSFGVLFKVVMPTLLPTLFSLTVMTFITGLCAMSAPTLLHYDSINPTIVELAGRAGLKESNAPPPEAQAALLSIILACFTVVLLLTLNHFERKGHYLSVSKTKAKLVKQKIQNPVANVLAHIYAYILFIIYMTPVVMIILFSFQNWRNVDGKILDFGSMTLSNYVGVEDALIPKSGAKNVGKFRTVKNGVVGLFSYDKTKDSVILSFILSAIAAALVCVIVVLAVNYMFKHKKARSSRLVEAGLLFPWLLPTILICYSFRIYFKQELWYTFGQALYTPDRIRLLLVIAYVVVKLPFTLRMIKASFYAIDDELEEAARNLGSGPVRSFMRIKLPIVLPSVLAVFALNFNALFSEYDMGATFANGRATTLAMVVKSLTETGNNSTQFNQTGCRCAATVLIMIVSGIILYLVYGVGARDLAERLDRRRKRRDRFARITGVFRKKPKEFGS